MESRPDECTLYRVWQNWEEVQLNSDLKSVHCTGCGKKQGKSEAEFRPDECTLYTVHGVARKGKMCRWWREKECQLLLTGAALQK
jgi:hypothetical protein